MPTSRSLLCPDDPRRHPPWAPRDEPGRAALRRRGRRRRPVPGPGRPARRRRRRRVDPDPAEIDEALSHHPRIGERATGISRSEQASADADDPELVDAMARGNVAYEERFGRIFLIRAAGRSRREILAELDRRLVLDDDAERAEVAQQLREIAGLRLRTLAQGDA
ncbi:2-oxo-4-hydroxy-4-carboxy-5-ureidoimidazoline decarboxylase [Cellulomonas sp. ATA003]|uniref:2-oxo-4-hydroxy-4-carboxy-5-ureidoimidazoline decarboxylase n=1 Tax=Cellulomonas sp. ATA003 TaxID=3073064 RepID=UPI002873535B|nr:2-oxo-4-hydroxy-4-carboxy-5-ureidoimidazoline decarboxylase [Cellulomonas sp. ATA003]WNB86548.1 2-oxo-4-hydroxy-4-carboxy-5-ureidoimidazoline decarboxylase [Cellulomonas sp. ATA003]